MRSNFQRFVEIVDATLRDDRGWSLSGRIRFLHVGSGDPPDFHVLLASPDEVDQAAPGCSARYSCRVGPDVYINDERWQNGAETYADRPLIDYRRYVVLHEVGHWLELGHTECPARNEPAPVMHQQSISLDGCRSNVWPLARERRELRRTQL